jgi:biopolymer transport protein ExbD
MRRPAYHRDRSSLEIKMTPMIDVVFLLLIFFVCTASFQIVENVLPTDVAPLAGNTQTPVDLPDELEDLERVVVRVVWDPARNQPTWAINETAQTDLPAVRKHLGQIREAMTAVGTLVGDLPLVVDVDDEVPLGVVIDTYDVARQEGYRKIQLAADAS